VDAPHKTDRVKVLDVHDLGFLENKGDKNSIEAPLKLPSSMKLKKDIHDIFFKDLPTRLKRKTIRPKG